ncbi:uncharacterized protein ACA1_329850 [Acanthamoeba castellanii str. Neff]|uniref:Uncharacterized protein n=1 Tax=Acanthamoeba castellanii (strain ATCC 30010 / Neff) TaxID=1257118 RepID=L8GHJ6_ACACF|nr:uncharacterized protein ACA1_329850 [Acanthamoeba castellanii str. Neff]ELR12462.1 hypothetical protein ACA1_329850 [Acanthamoeba castellanii str. Neff]
MTRKSDPFDLVGLITPPVLSSIKAVGCRQFNETQTTRRFCSATAPTEGRFKDHECALFNDDTSATVTATIEEHTFMEIGFTLAVLPIGPATPYAVILYSPRARVSPEAPSDDSPSFLVVPYTDYWTVLTQEEDVYLSGPSAITFYPSTSSSSASSTTIGSVLITFSYSSFAVGCYSQVVTYDWLSLVGVLGGAAAFCCAAPSDDSPSFLVVPYTDYWTVLTQEEDVYLSGPSAIAFYPSTSSSSASSTTIGSVLITFSYSSFAVGCYSQVVTYDWLSLVGVLGGAAAFCCAVHEIVMFMFSKSLTCCCPDLAKRFNDDEEDDEEEEGEGEKPKASSSRSVKTTRKGMGAAKKGDGDDSDDDDDEDEQEAAARSLQEVGLMHHGFHRGDLVAAMYDDYGRSLSSERLPLL